MFNDDSEKSEQSWERVIQEPFVSNIFKSPWLFLTRTFLKILPLYALFTLKQ